MSFTNCRFVGTRNYLLLAKPATPDSASRFRLQGCTFEFDNAEPPLGSADQLTGVVFSGNTVFVNGPHRSGAQPREIVLGNAETPNSAVMQASSQLQLLAPDCRYLLPAGLRLSRSSSVVVGAGSALVLSEQAGQAPELYIGPDARLVVKKGGRLEIQPHTKLTVAGQLVVEEGAYFNQDAQAEVQQVGKGKLQTR